MGNLGWLAVWTQPRRGGESSIGRAVGWGRAQTPHHQRIVQCPPCLARRSALARRASTVARVDDAVQRAFAHPTVFLYSCPREETDEHSGKTGTRRTGASRGREPL